MKNNLLLVSALGISSLLLGQQRFFVPSSDKYILKNKQNPELLFNEGIQATSSAGTKKISKPLVTNPMAINIIDLGQAGNAFGIAFGGRTYLWADPSINSITFSHRSNDGPPQNDPVNGYIRYDYSTDGGQNWLVDQGPAYISSGNNAPPFANARYPQGVLYNPVGNTHPDSAYFHYFAPSLASVNGSGTQGGWGGHVHGTVQVSGNLFPTKTEKLSSRYLIPDAFTLTKTGVVYNIDEASDQANATNPVGYKDSMFVSKGIWNATKRDFDYTVSKIRVPVSKDNKNSPNMGGQIRVAFADDGLTGYFSFIGHSDFLLEPDSVYHLIIYKTTDGGTTWSAPINVSMDGAGPLLPVNATKFTTGFEQDAVVDANGNLHIIVPVSPMVNQGFAISNQGGTWGMFHVYTTDGGTNWKANMLGMPQTLVGTFGISPTDATNPSITEYNRGQISRNWTGDKIFFTWFDTDTLQFAPSDPTHANMHPNAFSKAYDINTNKWTDSITTANTLSSDIVTFGCVSYYVFNNTGTYTVPVAFQELTGDETKTGSTVQFKYVDGLNFVDADFKKSATVVALNELTGVNEIKENKGVVVSPNYPNPFNNNTTFRLTLAKASSVTVDVFNTMGQKVTGIDAKTYAAGSHNITIEAGNLSSGVYFYNVRTGNASVTQRMMVK